MFNKSSQVEGKLKKIEGEAIASIIDKSMIVTGELTFQGKARIDGTVRGNIQGEHLILSESGRIEGDVQLSSFNCFGTLVGNSKTELLTARSSCSIMGRIEASNLTVEPGASIEGEVLASPKASSKAPTTPSKDKK